MAEEPQFDFDDIKLEDVKFTKATDKTELKSSEIKYPHPGELYGKIAVPDVGVDVPLFFGDTLEILRYGAGQYMSSKFPGEIGTTIVGDHNGNQFGKLNNAEIGMLVNLSTTYGEYQFRIISKDIKNKDDAMVTSLLFQKKEPLLLLYTCYPIDSIGRTDDRIFVQCEYVSGPLINENE
ncbi:class D sortase [Pseudolactococcus hodotermopsidis]|nr:class D sortase [Lactococcus hodotermopsidis]